MAHMIMMVVSSHRGDAITETQSLREGLARKVLRWVHWYRDLSFGTARFSVLRLAWILYDTTRALNLRGYYIIGRDQRAIIEAVVSA